jgi:hypothetical protein
MMLIKKRMERSRYIFCTKKYWMQKKKFNLVDCLSIHSEVYNNEEFLFNFWLARESFFLLLEEMESKEAFKNCQEKGQYPVACQLLVFYGEWVKEVHLMECCLLILTLALERVLLRTIFMDMF